MDYDPLADLLELAAEYCDQAGQPSKALTLLNLRTVLNEEPELTEELLRRMAMRLKSVKAESLIYSR
jgi:hypothetical protein